MSMYWMQRLRRLLITRMIDMRMRRANPQMSSLPSFFLTRNLSRRGYEDASASVISNLEG